MSRATCWAAPVLALSACGAASVYPFYAEGQAYVDTSLVRAWRESSSSEGAVFSLQGTQYGILYTDSDGKSAQFVGTLFPTVTPSAINTPSCSTRAAVQLDRFNP